jgi:hypothetical protein
MVVESSARVGEQPMIRHGNIERFWVLLLLLTFGLLKDITVVDLCVQCPLEDVTTCNGRRQYYFQLAVLYKRVSQA